MVAEVHSGSLPPNTPLMFADGSAIYDRFAQQFITHKQGFFIMAPSGSGKTYFINNQKEKHWMDGDALWEVANAHPAGPWWLEPEKIDDIDQRSDIITIQAKGLGFWIIGASNNFLKPDAIVLPHWSTHKRYIRAREKENYDGGATSDRLGQVLSHRRWIRRWVKQGVPCFGSIQEATDFLAGSYATSFAPNESI